MPATLNWLLQANAKATSLNRSIVDIVSICNCNHPGLTEIKLIFSENVCGAHWVASNYFSAVINISGLVTNTGSQVIGLPIWTESIWKVIAVLSLGDCVPREAFVYRAPRDMQFYLG